MYHLAKKFEVLRDHSDNAGEAALFLARGLYFTARCRLKLDTRCEFTGSGYITLPPLSHGAARLAYAFREKYEPELVVLEKMIKPGTTALDVGANLGVYTVHMSRFVGPTGKVIAFEPVPNTFSYLKKSKPLLPNVTFVQSAVADKSGFGSAVPHSDDPGSIEVETDPAGTIEVTSLDDWCSKNGIGKVGFIKIDIEGGEYKALSGASNILKDRPIIQFEVNPLAINTRHSGEPTAFDLLRGNGYTTHIVADGKMVPVDRQPNELCNVIATP